MSEIVLTPEQEARVPEWRAFWTAVGNNTRPMTDDDQRETMRALKRLWPLLGLPKDPKVVFVGDPAIAGIACGIASGIHFLRVDEGYKGPLWQSAVAAIREMSDAAVLEMLYQGPAPERLRGAPVPGAAQMATAIITAVQEALAPELIGDTSAPAEEDAVDLLIESVSFAWRQRDGGNQWSSRLAYMSFMRYVVGESLDGEARLSVQVPGEREPSDFRAWAEYERAAMHSCVRYMHERFIFVSDRPSTLRFEGEAPHAPLGLAIGWATGYGAAYWRGTRIPSVWTLEHPELTASEALSQAQVEKRRAACEILGWGKVLQDLGMRTIAKDENPLIGSVVEVDLPDAPNQRFLYAFCPARKRPVAIPIPSTISDPAEAQAWSYPGVPIELIRSGRFKRT